jgi:hypothetical protein
VRETDIDTLERCCAAMAYGDLQAEDPGSLSETNFLRLFRLAQLTVEYLLHIQDRLVWENGLLKVLCPTFLKGHCDASTLADNCFILAFTLFKTGNERKFSICTVHPGAWHGVNQSELVGRECFMLFPGGQREIDKAH